MEQSTIAVDMQLEKFIEKNYKLESIHASIIASLSCEKDDCYSMFEKALPGYHARSIENQLKTYFMAFLALLYDTSYLLGNEKKFNIRQDIFKQAIHHKIYALMISDKIIKFFDKLKEIIHKLNADSTKELGCSEFDFNKGSYHYVKMFDLDFGRDSVFIKCFYTNSSDNIFQLVNKLVTHIKNESSIEETNDTLLKIWFKLHISSFFCNYMKSTDFRGHQIEIPFVRNCV